ncbi:MAG: 30S ribosomal protein S15 [bacterium]
MLKSNIIKKSRIHKTDTGSAKVQIALLDQKIKELTKHLRKHAKDVHSRHGLLKMVSKRKKLIKYLQSAKAK